MADQNIEDYYEVVLAPSTRGLLQAGRVHDWFYDLLMGFPPIAGVLNRVAERVGSEIQACHKAIPFVADIWGCQAKILDKVWLQAGNNTYEYLFTGLEAALAPLDAVLDLSVSAGQTTWLPEQHCKWALWRQEHVGTLNVVRSRTLTDEQRCRHRVALERWALGTIFTDEIHVTAEWPKTAVSV